MTKLFDLLVAGEINPDLVLQGDVQPVFGQVEKLVDSAILTIGSSSAIFACGTARLGLKVAFIGKCGDDIFGRFMMDEMDNHGVETGNIICIPGGSTGFSVILNPSIKSSYGDRAILTHPGLIPTLSANEITDDLLRQAGHLHVASYFLQEALQPGLHGLFERARSLGLTTSLDTNYDPSERWHGFDELLAVTNVFLPNEAEACSLTGTETANAAADKLAGKVETLAIKLGARGALGVSKGKKVRVNAVPVEVVDTVGAGDNFDAGFIYGYLQGWKLEECLRLAVVCGSLSTRSAGGTNAQPSLAEARAHLTPDT
jgi:sugar/nucleoside kinase (ribokinase family)